MPLTAPAQRERPQNGPDQILEAHHFYSTSVEVPVKLRVQKNQKQDLAGCEPVSLPTLLIQAAEKTPNQLAMAVKREARWIKWSYSDYLKETRTVGRAFLRLGLEERRSVAIMGFNSPEWFLANMAAVYCGSISVGIYPTNSAEATKYILANSRANVVVVEDDAQVQKVLQVKHELPELKAIVQYTGEPKVAAGGVVWSWKGLMKLGEDADDAAAAVGAELEARLARVGINECCYLIYTSGTTGKPKGVMLSHDNLTFAAKGLWETYSLTVDHERIVSYLPLSHIAANIIDVVLMTCLRGATYFADRGALKGTLVDTLKEVQPTFFFGVPRVWEKIQERMVEVGRANKGLKQQIGDWAKREGLKHSLEVISRQAAPSSSSSTSAAAPASSSSSAAAAATPASSIKYRLARKLVFDKVKAALGLNKCHSFFVSAAPFPQSTCKYFLSLDINILEVYGMSETSGPHTVNSKRGQQLGTAGRSMAGVQTKTDGDEGEIMMRGRHVMMGYAGDEDATAAALEDADRFDGGWLRSGDVGQINAEGFLKITGRKKEILITSGGENVPPVPIEDMLKLQLPCLSNVVLIGDQKKFLSCLLTLKTEVDPDTQKPLNTLTKGVQQWLDEEVSIRGVETLDELLTEDANHYGQFAAAIQAGIDRVNGRAVSNAQKIQKWAFLKRDFSVDGGEFGPTMKVKRHVVQNMYMDIIDRFYA